MDLGDAEREQQTHQRLGLRAPAFVQWALAVVTLVSRFLPAEAVRTSPPSSCRPAAWRSGAAPFVMWVLQALDRVGDGQPDQLVDLVARVNSPPSARAPSTGPFGALLDGIADRCELPARLAA